jgi:hypothetical protein
MNLLQGGPKKSGFSCSVIADKADAAFRMDCPVDIVKQLSVQKRQADIS